MITKKTITEEPMLVAFLVTGVSAASAADQDTAKKAADWREDYAYHLGMQSYIFSYPCVFMSELRYNWVTQPKNPKLVPYAPLNHFWHARDVMTADYRDGGGPSNDTLYSIVWLDLAKEPVILSHADMGDRYFTFEIAGMSSDNFGYIGTRTTGSKAGHFALVGPNWKGKLPEGVKSVAPSLGTKHAAKSMPYIASLTNTVLILGRTAVNGAKDVKNVNKLQNQYTLTPLSLWGKKNVTLPESRDVWQPYDRKTDPLADWKTINRAMTEDPPLAQNMLLVQQFKTIGIGPGQDVTKMDAGTQKGLARAAKDGRDLMTRIGQAGGYDRKVNGWAVSPLTMGSAGYLGDIVTRGVNQSMFGIATNDPEEAIYPYARIDTSGNKLHGDSKYTIHFPAGQLPDVKYFWSITLYDDTNNLVQNSINRNKLGSLDPTYRMAKDGSLTLYFQNESPGKDKEANWIPTPKDEFYLILRLYGPGKALLEGTYQIPGVVKVAVRYSRGR